MGMREYPDATFKVAQKILDSIKSYSDLMKYLQKHNIDFDYFAQYMQYGDTDYLKDMIIEANCEFEDFDEANDPDEIIQTIDKLFNKLQSDFEIKYKGFSIAIQYISSDTYGDVKESFFALTQFVKPKAYKLAEWVAWTEWA